MIPVQKSHSEIWSFCLKPPAYLLKHNDGYYKTLICLVGETKAVF